MHPFEEQKRLLTRRHFFSRASTGLGTAALASLLAKDARLPRCPACRTFLRKPNASSISSSMARRRNSTCSITNLTSKKSAARNCRIPCAWVSG